MLKPIVKSGMLDGMRKLGDIDQQELESVQRELLKTRGNLRHASMNRGKGGLDTNALFESSLTSHIAKLRKVHRPSMTAGDKFRATGAAVAVQNGFARRIATFFGTRRSVAAMPPPKQPPQELGSMMMIVPEAPWHEQEGDAPRSLLMNSSWSEPLAVPKLPPP
mmetsp:Transcript_3022/g.10991  ORF Transcript_3022/g.10991 Transcript_3022/m.10991 type:complete len:164 (+) Transcript_3022:252-743(+)